MKKDYSQKIKKMIFIHNRAKMLFFNTGVLCFAWMLFGGIIAAIVAGITGYNDIIRFVIAAFFFGIAIFSFIINIL